MRSPLTGAETPTGAHPKNTGGKKGRSGRYPNEFRAFLARLREHPDVQKALLKAATDPDSRGFAAVLRVLLQPEVLTVAHPEVKLRIQQTLQLIASRPTWDSQELLIELSTKVWSDQPKRPE